MADKSLIQCASNWKRPNLTQSPELFQQVAKLLKEIETGGDLAIDNLSKRFDGYQPRKITLKPYREYELEPQLLKSIEQAAQRIEAFCQLQKTHYSPRRLKKIVACLVFNIVQLKQLVLIFRGTFSADFHRFNDVNSSTSCWL